MEEAFRKEVLRWEVDYPQQWQELMNMCDEAAAGKQAGVAVEAALKVRQGEEEEEEESETEKQVQAIARLEKERASQANMPMLGKVELWEEERIAGAKEVVEIRKRYAYPPTHSPTYQGKSKKKGKRKRKHAHPSTHPHTHTHPYSAKKEKEEEEEEEEEEYVPIDAMYRDELEVAAADGTSVSPLPPPPPPPYPPTHPTRYPQ